MPPCTEFRYAIFEAPSPKYHTLLDVGARKLKHWVSGTSRFLYTNPVGSFQKSGGPDIDPNSRALIIRTHTLTGPAIYANSQQDLLN